jgi:two-component system cell cycle response regulator
MEEINFNAFQTEGMPQLNDNLFNDYESQMMKYQGFLELTKVVTSTLQESKLHQVILYACQGQYLIKNASLILINSQSDIEYYEDVLSTGLKKSQYHITLQFQSDIIKLFTKEDETGNLSMNKEPHLAIQVFRDLNWKGSSNILTPLKPEVIIPLWGRGSFLGFFILGTKLDDTPFSQDELESLSQFSELASVSIENARLFDMAVLDKMTGLFNHHFFKTCLFDEINKAKKKRTPLSLIICDLDHFKSVNDTYGHQVGDFILKTFARVVKRVVGGKYICARYGGEEFAIIFAQTTLEDTLAIAENIRTSFEKLKYRTKKGEFNKTVSMGIAEYDLKTEPSTQEFIEMADKSLYASKETGRNKITVYSKEIGEN